MNRLPQDQAAAAQRPGRSAAGRPPPGSRRRGQRPAGGQQRDDTSDDDEGDGEEDQAPGGAEVHARHEAIEVDLIFCSCRRAAAAAARVVGDSRGRYVEPMLPEG